MEVSTNIHNLETETAFSILAKANELKSKGHDIINLGIGQPDFKSPNRFKNRKLFCSDKAIILPNWLKLKQLLQTHR